MKIITLGIDLAKNVFAVHGIDESGKGVLVHPNVRRDQLLKLIATLPPCVIGMEACSGAHRINRGSIGSVSIEHIENQSILTLLIPIDPTPVKAF